MDNQFSDALKSASHVPREPVRASRAPAIGRGGLKHVGGYFAPEVSKRLRMLASEEDTTVQELLAEGINLLFRSRGRSVP